MVFFGVLSCENKTENTMKQFLVKEIPDNSPIAFKENLIASDKLIHKGIFSPELDEYYYTISSKNFEDFEVYMIKKRNGIWSEPEKAFFNSDYNEHGMSFSPDGNSLFFSSTRPVPISGVPSTWHIWHTEKINGAWSEPVFVDITNLRGKLISHPTIANSGTLYFHSSNLDYTEMQVYSSKQINGRFADAKKIAFSMDSNRGTCTPYISPEENYLIFASIGEQLDLMISFNDGKGGWTNTRKLNDRINDFGQGNPYVTPDDKYLFFTTGGGPEKEWKVKWVNIESELRRINQH